MYEINNILPKMTPNLKKNLKIIKKEFGSLEYKNEDNEPLLHIIVNDKNDELQCYYAILTMLNYNTNPNITDDFKYNFIQSAIYAGFSEDFILKIISESIKYNLNINHTDEDKDTIMHTLIYADDYTGDIINIYKLLCNNGFDSTKVDKDEKDLYEAVLSENKLSKVKQEEFKKEFDLITNNKKEDNIDLSNYSIEEIENYISYKKLESLANDDEYQKAMNVVNDRLVKKLTKK